MEPEATPATGEARSRYWYHQDGSVVEVLQAVRRFRRSDQLMRRRMCRDMGLNLTDLEALRFVIAREREGRPVTAHELSSHLQISTASTTKLLDRTSASGHLQRSAHPEDGRSVILTATPHAHDEIRTHLTAMHERMEELARGIPSETRAAVAGFLQAMADLFDEDSDR